MRSLLLASVAAVVGGSPVPAPPPPPEPAAKAQPCDKRKPLRSETPSAAQRYLPGLF